MNDLGVRVALGGPPEILQGIHTSPTVIRSQPYTSLAPLITIRLRHHHHHTHITHRINRAALIFARRRLARVASRNMDGILCTTTITTTLVNTGRIGQAILMRWRPTSETFRTLSPFVLIALIALQHIQSNPFHTLCRIAYNQSL